MFPKESIENILRKARKRIQSPATGSGTMQILNIHIESICAVQLEGLKKAFCSSWHLPLK